MAACAGASGAGRPLVMMAVLGVLWGGACFGFNGIKRVLLIEGLFLDACDGGEARCGAQLDRLDFAWTFSSSMLNVFAIVNGCAIDALGLRRVCFLSGGLLGLGAVCFGLVVTRARLEYLLAYAYFALVESGMLLSFGGLSLQGAEGSVALCGRVFDVKVVAAPVMETAFALGTLGYYVATFSEQAAWHGRPETLGALLDWGFPALALPSLVVVARLEERWHDGGFERTCGHGYAALALAQVIWGVLSAARDWRLQIGAVALFVPARLLGFVHLYESVGFFFPPEHFGVVAGTCASVGGLAAAVASECLKRPAAAPVTPVAALDFGESAPARDSAVASYADESELYEL
ncbi:hypothetical protein SO694_000392113 [Aureococcus anophagefferens]|uniref:Uncharacterized protein n=1 Tax=Aureococcus anophagefferens TaxID=44056 RepID=A0ABR1FLS1_AURAN